MTSSYICHQECSQLIIIIIISLFNIYLWYTFKLLIGLDLREKLEAKIVSNKIVS